MESKRVMGCVKIPLLLLLLLLLSLLGATLEQEPRESAALQRQEPGGGPQ
jgi:hypothetical protein